MTCISLVYLEPQERKGKRTAAKLSLLHFGITGTKEPHAQFWDAMEWVTDSRLGGGCFGVVITLC